MRSFKPMVQSDRKSPPRNSSSAIAGASVTVTAPISILLTQSIGRSVTSKIGVAPVMLIATALVS